MEHLQSDAFAVFCLNRVEVADSGLELTLAVDVRELSRKPRETTSGKVESPKMKTALFVNSHVRVRLDRSFRGSKGVHPRTQKRRPRMLL